MSRNYWSNSKFADWLRGNIKPEAATSKVWREWRAVSESKHPIRYWLAEEGLDKVQGVLLAPFDFLHSIKYYINNRWVTRTHCLTANSKDIKPGTWCDVGNRFLPCLFNELVDFVEMELAWWHVVWDKEARAKFRTPFWGYGWWRWRTWRSPEAGIENLQWQMSLTVGEDWGVSPTDPTYGTPTQQALNAREIFELYNWWKNIRPTRPDPYDASGWTGVCEEIRNQNGGDLFGENTTPELEAKQTSSSNLLHNMEQQYEDEDEAMMIRLIRVRRSLWT